LLANVLLSMEGSKKSSNELPSPQPLPAKSADPEAAPAADLQALLPDGLKSEAGAVLEAGKSFFAGAAADLPPRQTKLPEAKRMEKYIDAVASQSAGGKYAQLGSCMAATKPALLLLIRVYLFVSPYFGWLAKWSVRLYELLPKNLMQMIFGVSLCYFGGTYVASIALVEAFRTMGWQRCVNDLTILHEQVRASLAAALTRLTHPPHSPTALDHRTHPPPSAS
jgi:hypothetical protein